jgi:diphthine-ammonia ligase
MTAPQQKACPKCGRPFSCWAQSDDVPCWCASLPPVVPAADGTDCRCPACLAAEPNLPSPPPRATIPP